MVEIHITQRPLHVLDSHAKKKTIFHLINAKIKINYNKKQTRMHYHYRQGLLATSKLAILYKICLYIIINSI